MSHLRIGKLGIVHVGVSVGACLQLLKCLHVWKKIRHQLLSVTNTCTQMIDPFLEEFSGTIDLYTWLGCAGPRAKLHEILKASIHQQSQYAFVGKEVLANVLDHHVESDGMSS